MLRMQPRAENGDQRIAPVTLGNDKPRPRQALRNERQMIQIIRPLIRDALTRHP